MSDRKERPPADAGHLRVVSACVLQLSQDHRWLGLSSLLCSAIRKKIGDPHQQWMLPHFSGRLLDHYSVSDIKSIYRSPSMTTEDLLMIILPLYNCERAFRLCECGCSQLLL